MSASQPTSARSTTAKAPPRRARAMRELPPEYEGLIALLEEAGTTLLSLPPSGFSPGLKMSALPILREAAEAYGWSTAEVRPPMPSASRISRMDKAMGYLTLIPQDRYLLRRIVGCRALVHPISGRHLYSWRRLAELLRADHKAIQRWHGEGIRIIVFALRRIAAEEKMAQTGQKPRIAEVPRAGMPKFARVCGSVERMSESDAALATF